MSVRQIVIDTETTGLSPEAGHRIIEIGGVELVDRKLTGNNFHHYLNPEREIEAGAIKVHGISNEFLADKPIFGKVAEEFLRYIEGATLIIHNAPFDVSFLNCEMRLSGLTKTVNDYATVFDTLALARKKHPGQRNNLDALCKRYNVDFRVREGGHGALIDATLLAQVYLAMTGGQTTLMFDEMERTPVELDRPVDINKKKQFLKVITANQDEETAHREYLAMINKASGAKCLWED